MVYILYWLWSPVLLFCPTYLSRFPPMASHHVSHNFIYSRPGPSILGCISLSKPTQDFSIWSGLQIFIIPGPGYRPGSHHTATFKPQSQWPGSNDIERSGLQFWPRVNWQKRCDMTLQGGAGFITGRCTLCPQISLNTLNPRQDLSKHIFSTE